MIAELSSNGGQRAIFHRVIDSKGRERRVFTAAEACLDDTGKVTALRGFTVDLSRTVALETRHAAAEAIRATYASREVIEQAKGIIMGLQGGTDGPGIPGPGHPQPAHQRQAGHRGRAAG